MHFGFSAQPAFSAPRAAISASEVSFFARKATSMVDALRAQKDASDAKIAPLG